MYQHLLQPGEEHDDQRRRATDRIWSKKTYRLRKIVEDEGNHAMYYLRKAGPQGLLNGLESTLAPAPWKTFVSEELLLIPEDAELPPDYVQEW